jgi:DNA primase
MALTDLNDDVISQVRQSADIVEFISQVTPLKAAGKSYKGLCPFHREKSPSFTVDRAKGLFYCFGCGVGGDVFKFLTLAERFTFPEAVEHVAGRLGIELPKKKRGPREADKDDFLELLDDASEAYHQALGWLPNVADEYLRSRHVPKEIVAKYGFGFAPDSWDYVITRLARKHGEKKLEAIGLAMPRKTGNGFYDRFRNRLMIPIHSETGSIVGFGGRSLDGSDPKYLNSPESEVFNKSRLLYNMHRSKDAMRRLERAILVEGYFDAIALDFAGVPGVIASMGTSLTIEQAKLMRRFAKRVVIAYDGDNAGRAATLRAAQILLSAGIHPEVLDLAGEKDPDSLIQNRGIDVFYDLLAHAHDIFDFAVAELGDGLHSMSGREKSEKLDGILPLLGAVTDPVVRNDAAQRISDAFGLEFETVWSRVRGRATGGAAAREPERRAGASEYTAEKMILTAALQGKVTPELAMRLHEEHFEDAVCRSIFKIIKTDLWDGHPIDFGGIATHLRGEAELTLLSELTLSEELDDRTLQRLDENLRPMEQGYCDRRQQQIQREITEAMRAGDEARLGELFAEKIEISRMLKTLK